MPTSLPFLSPQYLVLASVGTGLVVCLRGAPRQAAFLAVNVVALTALFLGPIGTASTLVFVGLGYGLIRCAPKVSRLVFDLMIAAFLLLFAWMRNYTFLGLVLPESWLASIFATMGLSFLLFKILHAAIDARGGALGEMSLPLYLTYCTSFIAFPMGPIQRFQEYRSQWNGEVEAIPLTIEAHLDAVIRVLFGLFRIAVLGGFLAPFMMSASSGTETAPWGTVFLQVYAFYFFLYCNFGGYCDVAIGLGSLMGIRPPENFNHPYLSRNVSEFWLRQHRSLTLWLSDYVFTPSLKARLQGNWFRGRRVAATVVSLLLTMLVSGLWHGTTLGFLLFGLVHAALLIIYRLWDTWLVRTWGRKQVTAWRCRPWVALSGMALTFNATAFAFVFFQLGARKGLALFARLWPL